jgi:molybdenum cofactor cytidylyltransferase
MGSGPRIAAVVLAGGSSRRMGGGNKLLAEVHGRSVIGHVVSAVLGSRARPVVVVTGHDASGLREALLREGVLDRVELVHNEAHGEGMSTSLRAGIAALGGGVDAALIVLGDLPRLRAAHVEAVAEAFVPGAERDLCAPVFEGRRGHPVLFPARCFPALLAVTGDQGGRDLLRDQAQRVRWVPVADDGVLADVDTPADLEAARSSR